MKRKRPEEGAPIVEDGGPPAWLTGQFPEHAQWKTWRTCKLRVDGKLGSGEKRAVLSASGMYRLEATDGNGYKVVTVQGSPPQKDDLRAGSLILGIDGFPLFGLRGGDLDDAFSKRLLDRAEVQLVDAQEFHEAEVERDGEDEAELRGGAAMVKEEVSGDGSLLVLPLGDRALRSLREDTRADLEGDLRELAAQSGIAAEVRCPEALGIDSIALRGDPDKVRAARLDLQEVLEFYGFRPPKPC